MSERVDGEAKEVDQRRGERRRGWISFRLMTLAKIIGGVIAFILVAFAEFFEKLRNIFTDSCQ